MRPWCAPSGPRVQTRLTRPGPAAPHAATGHHGWVTDDQHAAPVDLPPDPDAYDSPRNEIARRRGLPQPYIAGGADPRIEETLRRERPYLRLLVAMAIGIVILGFALGMAGALLPVPNV
jgi:hypothetical protein